MTLAYPSGIAMPWIVPPWTGTSATPWATTFSFSLADIEAHRGSSRRCRPRGNVPQPFPLDLQLGVPLKRRYELTGLVSNWAIDLASGCCCWLAASVPSIETTRSSRARIFSATSAFLLCRLRYVSMSALKQIRIYGAFLGHVPCVRVLTFRVRLVLTFVDECAVFWQWLVAAIGTKRATKKNEKNIANPQKAMKENIATPGRLWKKILRTTNHVIFSRVNARVWLRGFEPTTSGLTHSFFTIPPM
jgi:hypothetical protein